MVGDFGVSIGVYLRSYRGNCEGKRGETYGEEEDHEDEERKYYAKHFDTACRRHGCKWDNALKGA